MQVSPEDPEDPEDWLEVSPEELDGVLNRTLGSMGGANHSGDDASGVNLDESDGAALRDLAQKVQDFVGGEGDVEGARFLE